jgi:hypothetical protein
MKGSHLSVTISKTTEQLLYEYAASLGIKKQDAARICLLTALQKLMNKSEDKLLNIGFKADFRGGGFCNTCGECVNNWGNQSPAFFLHDKDDKWTFWCLDENCFPLEYKEQMIANTNYIMWKGAHK